MRVIWCVLIVFFSLNLFSQEKYAYEYFIHPDFKEDAFHCTLDSISAKENRVIVRATNVLGEVLAFGNVFFRSQDTVIEALLNEDGQLSMELRKDTYTVQVSSFDSKPYTRVVHINKNGLIMDVVLPRKAQLEGYVVKSKVRLNDVELEKIKHCIENSKDKRICEKKDKFYILIEI